MSIKKQQHFTDLFHKYLQNDCTSEEIDELFEMLSRNNDPEINKLIGTVLESNTTGTVGSEEKLKEKLEGRLNLIMKEIEQRPKPASKILYVKLIGAVAAAINIFFIVNIFFLNPKTTKQNTIAVKEKEVNDISAPSAARAILKLTDGSVVYLDSVKSGQLAVQGNVKVIKSVNGDIAYTGTNGEDLYNTLVNPRGSKVVNITLGDGTKVWLNAASSIHYPAAFTGIERVVEITGEAYFEVAHNKAMPFVVRKGETQVEVLGTHFNVNGYDDEPSLKITLLEGSVRVSANKSLTKILKPGQQGQVNNNGINVVNDVYTDEVMAWKNGKFQFNDKANIGTIMRQIGRWYDVDVEYKGMVDQHFWGSITRDANVSEVLKKIESTGGVKFKIEGRKVIVMP